MIYFDIIRFMSEFIKTEALSLTELTGGLVYLYHNTSPEAIPSIEEFGLVPGGIDGVIFSGIANTIADNLAPGNLKRQGVLRQNVVFAWLSKEDATEANESNLLTAEITIEPERVYVGDLSSSAYLDSRTWDLVRPAYIDLLTHFDVSKWDIDRYDAYTEFFEKHFFDCNFAQQITEFHNGVFISNFEAITEMLKMSKKVVWEKARPVAREYWRRVVPLQTFNDEYHFHPRTGMWVPENKRLVQIADPEAMIPGVIPKDRISGVYLGKST